MADQANTLKLGLGGSAILVIDIPYTAKLSRGKTFVVVHKTHHLLETFVVHQAHAIMYYIQQMIQGENFRDWLKNHKNRKSFPPRKFCRIRYRIDITIYHTFYKNLWIDCSIRVFH